MPRLVAMMSCSGTGTRLRTRAPRPLLPGRGLSPASVPVWRCRVAGYPPHPCPFGGDHVGLRPQRGQ
eukprot:6072311-Lingulodinium_polyedra.AAC.1